MPITNRIVKHLQLEKAFFVPGFGELKGRTLNSTHYPGIKMSICFAGILCQMGDNEFIIPFAKCEPIVLEKQVKKDVPNVEAA